MTSVGELIAKDRLQYAVMLIFSIGAVGLAAILYSMDRRIFGFLFGSANPVLIFLIVVIVGFGLMSFLVSQGWFAVRDGVNPGALLRAAGLAAMFAVVAIAVDLRVIYPVTNVPWPRSLLFYPAIAVLVEILFHVVPLALLLVVLTRAVKMAGVANVGHGQVVWIAIVLVALLEPTFQVLPGASRIAAWAVAVTWLNIFLINLSQLVLFKRYDFVTMYALRIAYYLVWHIVWGHVRLGVLLK